MTWRKACHKMAEKSGPYECVHAHGSSLTQASAQALGSCTCMYTVSQCEPIASAWKVLTNGGDVSAGDAFSHTKRQLEKLFKLHFHKGSPKPAGLLNGMRNK